VEWFLIVLILFMFAVGIYLLIRGPGQRMCTLCGGYGGQPQWKGGEVCTRCHGSGVIPRDAEPDSSVET
jgi:DnaJ-class molecular chaperone